MDDWWKGAVLYQIYPRSFRDSNGDGVGDLPGVTEKLSYVAELGVDGIWLSPFFRSPMDDFGYDVSDPMDVDPLFGSLRDFDQLLNRAHELGLKVVIDQVVSHTSDRHPWFQESRTTRDGPRSDWYVWADPKADGSPPNNWLSYFGGPAWSWDTQRRQYYLHNFLPSQPDLNFHEPAVRQAVLDVARFWLERGVDGFRIDASNYCFHDPELRDNPPSGNRDALRPYGLQAHRFNRSRPEMKGFLEEFRRLLDSYDARMSVAEIASSSHQERALEYTRGRSGFHTAYHFIFLESQGLSPDLVRASQEPWLSEDAWPSWAFSNHDFPRVVSRWGTDLGSERAGLYLALLVGLRGNPFLYQGEELGLPQGHVPFHRLQDPEAKRFWPHTLGRDGCRTPLPWDRRAPHAGFSTAEPWLPVEPSHLALAVAEQEVDPDSTLHLTRRLLRFRKEHPAMVRGELRFMQVEPRVLAFERRLNQDRVLCVYNLSRDRVTVPASQPSFQAPLLAKGVRLGPGSGGFEMEPFGFFFGRSGPDSAPALPL